MNATRFVLAVLLVALLVPPAPVHASASLELYGTFQAMGVIVTVAADDDPDLDATTTVEYRVSGSGAYRQGFPLSRVAATRFVGSLFWLEPGTSYDVRVTFGDPDHGPLDGDTVQGTASTRAEITIPTPTKSYYVSPTGSGTACTLAGPCSLSYAVSQAQAGEEIVLRGGVYYQDEISLPRSGTSNAPIIIRGYEGETAILDGADPDTFTWTHYSGGVYRTTINTDGTHLVLSNGQRLFPYDDLNDLQNLSRDNTPGFYADSTTLYVHLEGDANPNSATMIVSRYSTAFYVAQDYI